MALPSVDSDKAFAVQLQVESVDSSCSFLLFFFVCPLREDEKPTPLQYFQTKDPLNNRKYVSIQNALLYTTSLGERRIRVATVCLPVTSSLSDLFKHADVDAVVTLMSKMGGCHINLALTLLSLSNLVHHLPAVEKALVTKLSDARQAVLHKCIDILSVYRSVSPLWYQETFLNFPFPLPLCQDVICIAKYK